MDEWPIEQSGGWLLARVMELMEFPESWKGQPVGWGGDVPGDDPWWDAEAEAPPPGWADHLPMYIPDEEGVSDGE